MNFLQFVQIPDCVLSHLDFLLREDVFSRCCLDCQPAISTNIWYAAPGTIWSGVWQLRVCFDQRFSFSQRHLGAVNQ